MSVPNWNRLAGTKINKMLVLQKFNLHVLYSKNLKGSFEVDGCLDLVLLFALQLSEKYQ